MTEEKKQAAIPGTMPPEPEGVGFSNDLNHGLGWMYATDPGTGEDDEPYTE